MRSKIKIYCDERTVKTSKRACGSCSLKERNPVDSRLRTEG